MLQMFGIQSWQNVVFVTDRGSNIIAALSEEKRLNCAAHLINNVLENTFKERNLQASPYFQPVLQILQSCRDLIGYFKRSALMEKLESALEQIVPTRWNTHLAMLASVLRNWEKIKEVTNLYYYMYNNI